MGNFDANWIYIVGRLESEVSLSLSLPPSFTRLPVGSLLTVAAYESIWRHVALLDVKWFLRRCPHGYPKFVSWIVAAFDGSRVNFDIFSIPKCGVPCRAPHSQPPTAKSWLTERFANKTPRLTLRSLPSCRTCGSPRHSLKRWESEYPNLWKGHHKQPAQHLEIEC
jgi:hypothetical protein